MRSPICIEKMILHVWFMDYYFCAGYVVGVILRKMFGELLLRRARFVCRFIERLTTQEL